MHNNATKQTLRVSHSWQIHSDALAIEALEPCYLDAIQERNEYDYNSPGYLDAIKEAERIERLASQFAFNDDQHSFTECLEESALMAQDWQTSVAVSMSSYKGLQYIEPGTPAFRKNGKFHVLRFRQENGKTVAWELYVPSGCVEEAGK